MLRIYIAGETMETLNIITDVESAFGSIKLTGSPSECKFIELIDKGKWASSSSFIDRFGIKLKISELSTGCKAALCVLHYSNSIVDLRECGLNAVSSILSFCKEGAVILTEHEVAFTDYNQVVDLQLDMYRFKTIRSFNRYLDCERFCFEPDLSTGEVELCFN